MPQCHFIYTCITCHGIYQTCGIIKIYYKKGDVNMKLKKAIALLTILCVLLTMTLTVYSVQANTVNDKVKTLNRLTVLMGDGVDFNLDGQLRRSEVATFIVRLMGKETEVLANKAKWSVADYMDVENNAWYAPYIGYCSQLGIIGGFPDGTYKPNDNISEKAFLKLVLGVLGYKYNTHFTWSNVLQKSYDVGLIDDPNYQYMDKDNINYKRSAVVDVLYNSLDRVNRETKVTVLDNLISLNIVDRTTAVEEGLIEDPIITAITNISVIDANTIKIKFNESIEALTDAKIEIYDSQSQTSKLTVKIKSQSSDEVIVTTSAQIPKKNYTVKISDIVDLDGNRNSIIGSFTGYQNVEVNSTFFRINKVEAVSKNVINVFFTHPISMNVELPMYYEILDGDKSFVKGSFSSTTIKVLAPYDNAVSIFVKEKDFLDGANYTLKINGDMTSIYNSKLNNGSGDVMSFTASAKANESFYITNVTPINKEFVKVQFSKDVDISTAQVSANYTIKDSNGVPGFISKAVVTNEGVYKNKEVTLQVNSLIDSSNVYILTMNNIYDSFNQMQLPKDEKYQLTGNSKEVEDLTIVNVFAEDKGTLHVYFNRPLNELTATDPNRYTLMGVTNPGYSANPSSVYYDSVLNPYMVKLSIPSDAVSSPDLFKLKVDWIMQDYMGKTTSDTYFTFSGVTNENVKPYMVEALIISNDTIKVTFNEEISSAAPNTLTTNYSLQYKEGSNTIMQTPVSVAYINERTLTLRFNDLSFSKNYMLRFTDRLVDYSGANFRLASDNANGISVYLGN